MKHGLSLGVFYFVRRRGYSASNGCDYVFMNATAGALLIDNCIEYVLIWIGTVSDTQIIRFDLNLAPCLGLHLKENRTQLVILT